MLRIYIESRLLMRLNTEYSFMHVYDLIVPVEPVLWPCAFAFGEYWECEHARGGVCIAIFLIFAKKWQCQSWRICNVHRLPAQQKMVQTRAIYTFIWLVSQIIKAIFFILLLLILTPCFFALYKRMWFWKKQIKFSHIWIYFMLTMFRCYET